MKSAAFVLLYMLSSVLVIAQDNSVSPAMRATMEASRPSKIQIPKLEYSYPAYILATPPQSAFTNVNLIEEETDKSPMQNESGIAVNPRNTKYLIASAVDYRDAQSAWVYVSEDGGKTWKNVNLGKVSGLNFTVGNDPSVAWDYNGVGYVVYGGFDVKRTSGENGVFLSKTTDNGKTWIKHIPVILHTGTMTKDSAFEDKYYISIDNANGSPYKGHLYIPWKRVIDRDSSTRIVITKSTDQGQTWSTPIQVSNVLTGKSLDTTFGQSFPIITTGPNGEVYCAWNYGPLHNIGFNKSTDGGKTWGTPRLVADYKWLGIARNTGSQYNHTLKGATRVESYPSIVVDTTNSPRKGWVYLTWAADRTPNVYFSRSTDGGTTWSTPTIVHSDTTNDQYWQWMALDGTNGDLAVIYLDSRDDATNMLSRCYVSYSSDGGTTWYNRMASDEGFDIRRNPFSSVFSGDYSGCAFYNGVVYPSTVDMRNTTATNFFDNDVYSAIINVRAPLPVDNFTAKTIADKPNDILLSWSAPTQRSFGQPLNLPDYSYVLYRDGNRVGVIPSSQTQYTDTPLPAYSKHTYTIVVATATDTSADREAVGFAGGSPNPDAATLSNVTAGNQLTATITVRTPNLREDSVNALTNLAKILVYRDSVLVKEFTVSNTDTNKTIQIPDDVPERGFYTYYVVAQDALGHNSKASSALLAYVGPIEKTLAESFDATKLPRYLVRGGWEQTDEFASSTPNALTESKRRQYTANARDTITFFPVQSADKPIRVRFLNAAIVDSRDTAIIEYSSDNMATWNQLAVFNKTQFAAWDDKQLTSADWKPELLTLPKAVTTPVYIRFRFRSNISINDEGWFIDDLQLEEGIVSVEEQTQTNLHIYPNPATDYVRILVPSTATITITDMLGNTIDSNQLLNNVNADSILLDVSSLPQGTYIVQSKMGTTIAQQLLKVVR